MLAPRRQAPLRQSRVAMPPMLSLGAPRVQLLRQPRDLATFGSHAHLLPGRTWIRPVKRVPRASRTSIRCSASSDACNHGNASRMCPNRRAALAVLTGFCIQPALARADELQTQVGQVRQTSAYSQAKLTPSCAGPCIACAFRCRSDLLQLTTIARLTRRTKLKREEMVQK